MEQSSALLDITVIHGARARGFVHAFRRRFHTARRSGSQYTACNILDIIHPLWLAAKQTSHERARVEAWARAQLDSALAHWVDGEGFAFAPRSRGTDAVAGLQGTEMWLTIVWLLADYLGVSEAPGYRAVGVHNPDPLVRIAPVDRV